MITPALLLAVFQLAAVAPDSTYSSVALSAMVEMASRTNRHVPAPLLGYTALIESEVALLVNTPGGADGAVAGTAAATTEAAAQIEQFVLKATWGRSGSFHQEQVGYRARLLGPSISALNILPAPVDGTSTLRQPFVIIVRWRTIFSNRRHYSARHACRASIRR